MIGEEDAAIARNWQRHADRGDPPAMLTRELGWWRDKRGAVFRQLIANDERAERIAKAQGWLTADDVASDWAAIDAPEVRRKIQAVRDSAFPLLFGKFLATALRNHAPQHLGLLPPQWLDPEQDNVVQMPLAAAPMPSEVKRGPVIDDEDDPP